MCIRDSTSRDFIGRDNIKERQSKGVNTKLAYLVFDDDLASECFGNEAVYHETRLVGLTTSGAFGHRIGKSLAFAYIEPTLVCQGSKLQILTTAGKRNCHVEIDPAYDPENNKLRG